MRIRENKRLRDQVARLNGELGAHQGLIIDGSILRSQFCLPLAAFVLSSMAKLVDEEAQRQSVGNDEIGDLCIQLCFYTLSD